MVVKNAKIPKVAKKGKSPFKVSVACWIDLLGYGQMISKAKFNPMRPQAVDALQRLMIFHRILADHSTRQFPTFVMNDGAVAYRDLSLSDQSVTYDFLIRSWKLFKEIRTQDKALGHPGPRMVLACGFRMSGRRRGVDIQSQRFRIILRKLKAAEIDAVEAIHQAASIQPTYDIVPQLQANFAFTKAYVAESSGTKGGLPGSQIYIDLNMFSRPRPKWITLGPSIPWAYKRLKLSGEFAAITSIKDLKHPPAGPAGLLNGYEIAEAMTGDKNIRKALRDTRKPKP